MSRNEKKKVFNVIDPFDKAASWWGEPSWLPSNTPANGREIKTSVSIGQGIGQTRS